VVCLSVCLSVRLSQSATLQKWQKRSRCCLSCGLGWAQKHVLDGGTDLPMRRGSFEVKGAAHCKVQVLCSELCKNGWTHRDAVWDVDSGGPKEPCIRLLHIGATWRIRLNRPCTMRPYVNLLWPLVIIKTGTEPVVGVEINARRSICARIKISAEDDLLLTELTYNDTMILVLQPLLTQAHGPLKNKLWKTKNSPDILSMAIVNCFYVDFDLA